MLYAGSLYATRTPDALIDAFCDFLDAAPHARGRAVLEFIGRPGPHMEAVVNRRPGAIRYGGLLPHTATCRAMADADVNIVLLPNLPGSENDTTAKIYECLGSGRPILAAVPAGGAAADVLCHLDGVSRCDPDDREAIRASIAHWFERRMLGPIEVHRSAEELAMFTREAQARQLAACLNEIVPAAGRKQTT